MEFQFDTFCKVTKVSIYETYNPGFTHQISLYDYDQKTWIPVWSGNVQTNLPAAARIFSPTLTNTTVCSNRIRLDINTATAPSYYEIDAIEIEGYAMKPHPDAKEKTIIHNTIIPEDVPVAVQWVEKVNAFSSEYSASWPAKNVIGNIYLNIDTFRQK